MGSCDVVNDGNGALLVRLGWGAAALACLGLLILAAGLEPDAGGLGTHRQLGMQGCQWLDERGFVCPTCGMTTAFALAADGRIVAAFATQPAGALAAFAVAMAVWLGGFAAASGYDAGRWLAPLWRWRTALIALVIVLLAWLYKLATT